MSDHPEQQPKFATTMRGYDRLQVDDYVRQVEDHVTRLGQATADAEERARLAESELESRGHATVGARVTQILDLAEEEAKELRERANAEAELTRSQARSQCEEMIARARAGVRELLNDAEIVRRDILAGADAKRLAVEAEVERLTRSRDTLLRDFERLQRVLAQATSTDVPGLPAGPASEEPYEPVEDSDAEEALEAAPT